MFDQRNVYLKNDTLLQGLVDFENKVQQIGIEEAINVQFSANGKTLQFSYKGLVMHGKVDRPLIHQLGGRAWRNAPDFKTVSELWAAKFSRNRAGLEQELVNVFNNFDLTIRYIVNAKNENKIYGIVTPTFIDVDQRIFRAKFMQQMQDITGLTPTSEGICKHQQGGIMENFKFDNNGFQTQFKYGLVYARNNGYEAYRRSSVTCFNINQLTMTASLFY